MQNRIYDYRYVRETTEIFLRQTCQNWDKLKMVEELFIDSGRYDDLSCHYKVNISPVFRRSPERVLHVRGCVQRQSGQDKCQETKPVWSQVMLYSSYTCRL